MNAKTGDTVKVHYTLKAADGEVIESSDKTTPIELTIGGGKSILGFENKIIGMSPNDSKTITVPAEEAYGHRNENMVFEFSKEKAPEGFEPQVGEEVQLHRPNGKTFTVTVIDITEKGFKMDANHPLAGKDLFFDLELVEIVC